MLIILYYNRLEVVKMAPTVVLKMMKWRQLLQLCNHWLLLLGAAVLSSENVKDQMDAQRSTSYEGC